MTDPKILDRIRKCLALSKSSNEHEAAAALRQARKLMEANALSEGDILALEVAEERARSGAKSKPALWEAALVQEIAMAFGCRILHAGGRHVRHGEWIFIGVAPAPEIARYAFDVLIRQVKRAREDYLERSCLFLARAAKTRRGDIYCQGWVVAVAEKVGEFAANSRHEAAINAYMDKRYENRAKKQVRDRSKGLPFGLADQHAYQRGMDAGKEAQIHHGMHGGVSPLALE